MGPSEYPVLRVTTMLAKRRRNSSAARGAVPQNTSNARGRKAWLVLSKAAYESSFGNTLSNASGSLWEPSPGSLVGASGSLWEPSPRSNHKSNLIKSNHIKSCSCRPAERRGPSSGSKIKKNKKIHSKIKLNTITCSCRPEGRWGPSPGSIKNEFD